jgi:hypothetical protein
MKPREFKEKGGKIKKFACHPSFLKTEKKLLLPTPQNKFLIVWLFASSFALTPSSHLETNYSRFFQEFDCPLKHPLG